MYSELLTLLKARSGKLATAESCTGGLVAAAITNIAGISEVYSGSIIAYENSVKNRLLDVPQEVFDSVGAVSSECAHFMVKGAAGALQANYAIATTGIAGPTGAVPGKPVGTVYIGYYLNGRIFTERNNFSGDRDAVRAAAVERSLKRLIELIKQEEAK